MVFAAGAAGAVSLVPAATAVAATGPSFSLEPVPLANGQAPRSSFRYTMNAGSTLSDQIRLTNLTNQPEQFEIWTADGYNTPRSGYLSLRPVTYPKKDVGKWISLPVGNGVHVLPAATAATLTFELTVPPNATPGDHVGGIVALDVSPQTAQNGHTQFAIRQGIASAVFVHVTGALHPSAAVVGISVAESDPALGFPTGSSRAFVAYRLANTGNTLLQGHAVVRVTDVFGRTVKTFPSTPVGNFLPGQTFTVVEPKWQPLPFAGPEHVSVRFVPQGAAVATGAATFWVFPWLLLLVLIVLASGALWWMLRRRRRRRTGPGPARGPEDAPDVVVDGAKEAVSASR